MAESLRYYIAHNGGLNVMENRSGSMQTIAEHFPGVTLEHLIGETSLPLTLALVAGGKASPSRVVDLLSAGPARLLSLKGKGTLAAGADADVTVVDPDAEWEFREEDILSKSRNSPFLDWKLRGRATVTICGGRIRHSGQAGVDTDG